MCNLKPRDTENRFLADFNKMGKRPKQKVQQKMKGWQRGAGVGKKRGREEGRRQTGKKEEHEKKKSCYCKGTKRTELQV